MRLVELAEEIRGLVEQELVRLGQRATPRLEQAGQELAVGSGRSEGRADIRGTLVQWESLPDDLRDKRIRQIAELLAQGLARPAPVVAPKQKLSNRPGLLGWFWPLVIVVLTVLGLALAFRVLAPSGGSVFEAARAWWSGSSPRDPVIAQENPAASDRSVLAGTTCQSTVARVARGAVIGPADVEGFQVELVLMKRSSTEDLTRSPALERFVKRAPGQSAGTWIWPRASSLVEAQRFDAQVEVSSLTPPLRGVRLLFTGPYVSPYFSEDLRSDYFALADALAEALAATDGALYAHCAGSNAHYIGSWFLGSNPGNAVASLIYFMNGDAASFEAIGQAAGSLDRAAVATLVGNEQGMISGRPTKPSRLMFPFRDANRASRAALGAARALKLAR